MPCFCGSGNTFEQCCQQIIAGVKKADTPEQLMRSRYSAYAIKDSKYLFDSTAKAQQSSQLKDEISDWANQTKWLKLDVIEATDVQISTFSINTPAIVEFNALYLYKNRLYQMNERSYFIIEDEQWKYANGDSLAHDEISQPKRNEPCPCQSGKKFKRCCSNI